MSWRVWKWCTIKSWNEISIPTLLFFFFRDRDILHHLEPPVRKLVVNPSMFGSDDAEDSDDTRATALPGGYFFNVDPDLYIPRSCQSNWWIAGNLFWRKQLVYPRRKRWPLGSALRVSLLCQICSFPSGFIVCGSRSLDVRSISHVFKFSTVQNLELETF